MKRGLVLGKFLPPHLGHLYLCEFARGMCDDLTVVVGTLAREPIPGALRARWMAELLPGVRVVHLTDENPQEPAEHPDFWAIWRASLERVLPHRVDLVFASEPYGEPLAGILGAEFVPVDLGRTAIPISGTSIREDPLGHWEQIPRCVRPWFVRRVCVFGPESTGKSTLAARLARHFQTVCVPEYARTYLEARGGHCTAADMEPIARGQIASEEALARSAHRLLFSDTDVLLTTIWEEALFGQHSPWIEQQAAARVPDLYLLTDVDVPWVADPVRYLPDERRAFFARCEAELQRRGRRYVVIRGSWEDRFAAAVAAVEAISGVGPTPSRR
jgi:NadR type nicotinamide-nucleotide adenylyltransferase